jgi:DNA (cytosine-5)-methyltransferase 1
VREIIVDNFAGGGGASTGIELAVGRSVDIFSDRKMHSEF